MTGIVPRSRYGCASIHGNGESKMDTLRELNAFRRHPRPVLDEARECVQAVVNAPRCPRAVHTARRARPQVHRIVSAAAARLACPRTPSIAFLCIQVRHALREGHRRRVRHDGGPEVRNQPRDPEHGLGGAQGDAGIQGGEVIVVPARDTSRKCHECGAVEAASRRTRDGFVCLACGHAAHADLNAARNIRDRALRRIVPMNETSGTGASARRAAFALATSDP